MSFLKNHPFAVEAFFESSLVFTFAVPKEALQTLIPKCLSLDTFQEWGFVAVAMVQTTQLRPKGFPAWLGNDFFLVGYRVFVRYTNHANKRLRGLYILKTETDKKSMEWLGNTFTHYQYATTDIKQSRENDRLIITSKKSDFNVEIRQREHTALPEYSPFADWKEARRFAGPLPFTFSYLPKRQEVLIVEGVRQYWKPAPVEVVAHRFSFMKELPFPKAILANAFVIRQVPYYWKKGKVEPWNP